MSNGWENTQEFQKIQLAAANLAPHAAETDELFKTMGFGSAGDFLTNIMGQESHYGYSYNPEATHTMTQAQIDPIRYHELLSDIEQYPGWANKANIINKYMQSKPGYEDWDISNMAQLDVQPKSVSPYAPGTMHGPYALNEQNFDFNYVPGSISPHTADPTTAFMLSRLMLTKDKQDIPVSPEAQAAKWNSFWNRNPNAGDDAEFLQKLNQFRPVDSMMNNYNQVKNALPTQ